MKKTFTKMTAVFAACSSLLTAVSFTAGAEGNMKIVAMGDSITNGYSMDGSLIASYPELVSSYYGADLVNFAQDGLTSEGLLAQLADPAVQSELASADAVLITIGGNDIMGPALNNDYITASEYSTMSELIAAMKAQNESDSFFMVRMQKHLNSVMPPAIAACGANVQQINAQISAITSAPVVIQTVYNPMDLADDDTPLASSGSMNVLSANVNGFLEGKPDNTTYPQETSVNAIIRGLAGAAVADIYNVFAGHSYFYTHINNVDVHPNSKGHLAMAETVIELLGLPETGNENGTLFRRAYTYSGAEGSLAAVRSDIDEGIRSRVLKNCYGDVDANGAVELADASYALNVYAATAAGVTPEITGVNALAADANTDGAVNTADATLMLGYYAESAAGVFSGTFNDYLASR
ncbi:MAG: GDSL-type esterase/lipase family protein [Ruminococcus sp.]